MAFEKGFTLSVRIICCCIVVVSNDLSGKNAQYLEL